MSHQHLEVTEHAELARQLGWTFRLYHGDYLFVRGVMTILEYGGLWLIQPVSGFELKNPPEDPYPHLYLYLEDALKTKERE